VLGRICRRRILQSINPKNLNSDKSVQKSQPNEKRGAKQEDNRVCHEGSFYLGEWISCGRRAEVIYQRALAIEMEKAGLQFQREMEMTILYEGIDIGTRRVDFFVEETFMVELKALIKLEEVHLAQAMNYCQAYNLPIGLLINFGARSLEFKRVYNVNHPENKGYKR
jgi:GxxExxY protein